MELGMKPDATSLEAEHFRRSHCDRKHHAHQCIGKVTLAPGVLLLDCELCGTANEELRGDMVLCDAAQSIAATCGRDFSKMAEADQREVLLELLSLKRYFSRRTL